MKDTGNKVAQALDFTIAIASLAEEYGSSCFAASEFLSCRKHSIMQLVLKPLNVDTISFKYYHLLKFCLKYSLLSNKTDALLLTDSGFHFEIRRQGCSSTNSTKMNDQLFSSFLCPILLSI